MLLPRGLLHVWLLLPCPLALAGARLKFNDLPHGLLPRELSGETDRIHRRVERLFYVEDADEEAAACHERLKHLRTLVAVGKVREAIDLSLALEARSHLEHPDCLSDIAHVGEGTVTTRVATPADRHTNSAAQPVKLSMIRLHNFDGSKDAKSDPLLHVITHHSAAGERGGTLRSAARAPVVGFALDGAFVLAESPLRCRPIEDEKNNRDLPRVHTMVNASGIERPEVGYAAISARAYLLHATGGGLQCDGGASIHGERVSDAFEAMESLAARLSRPKKGDARRLDHFMGMPLIGHSTGQTSTAADGATDDPEGANADVVSTYAVGNLTVLVIPLIPSDGDESSNYPYGYNFGLIASHFSGDVSSYLDALMQANSDFYERNSYGATKFVWNQTGLLSVDYTGATCGDVDPLTYFNGQDASSLDMMAFAAATKAGFDYSNYDLHLIFMPYCSSLSWAGIGWVGYPGAVMSLQAYNYEASVAHELGHNFGASHASYINGGARGAVAWIDEVDLWAEYGNPHSVMGQGDFEDANGEADFLVCGKGVFDWLETAELTQVEPFNSEGFGLCNPCGPFYLDAIDVSTKSANGFLAGLQIETLTANRYFYVEHRTVSTGGTAALITWSDVTLSGNTGYYGNTVLTDCTPDTTDWVDAGCGLGTSIVLDVGDETTSQELTLTVASALDASGRLEITLTTAVTYPPTVSPPPSSVPTGLAPTQTLVPTQDLCTQNGDSRGCCNTLDMGADFYYLTFTRLRDYDTYCCNDFCTWSNYNGYSTTYYLSYKGDAYYGTYYVTKTDGCLGSSYSYYASFTSDEVLSHCVWDPSTAPVPLPTTLAVSTPPLPYPSSLPNPSPSQLPNPAPSSKPSRRPSSKPTHAPVPVPSTRPSQAPTEADTVSVAVSMSMTTSVTNLTSDQEIALKTTVADTVGVHADKVKDFEVTISRRRRRLLTSYTMAVSFEVVTELSSTSASSTMEFANSVSSSLKNDLATKIAQESGLSSSISAVDTSFIAVVVATRNPSMAPSPAPFSNPTAEAATASVAKSQSSAAGAIIGGVVGVIIALYIGVFVYIKCKTSNDQAGIKEKYTSKTVNLRTSKAFPEIQPGVRGTTL